MQSPSPPGPAQRGGGVAVGDTEQTQILALQDQEGHAVAEVFRDCRMEEAGQVHGSGRGDPCACPRSCSPGPQGSTEHPGSSISLSYLSCSLGRPPPSGAPEHLQQRQSTSRTRARGSALGAGYLETNDSGGGVGTESPAELIHH